MNWRIDDEHGAEIAQGFQSREAAKAAALRWEAANPSRQAFVSEDEEESASYWDKGLARNA